MKLWLVEIEIPFNCLEYLVRAETSQEALTLVTRLRATELFEPDPIEYSDVTELTSDGPAEVIHDSVRSGTG